MGNSNRTKKKEQNRNRHLQRVCVHMDISVKLKSIPSKWNCTRLRMLALNECSCGVCVCVVPFPLIFNHKSRGQRWMPLLIFHRSLFIISFLSLYSLVCVCVCKYSKNLINYGKSVKEITLNHGVFFCRLINVSRLCAMSSFLFSMACIIISTRLSFSHAFE